MFTSFKLCCTTNCLTLRAVCFNRVAEIHESYVFKNMQRQTWSEMSYFPGVFRC